MGFKEDGKIIMPPFADEIPKQEDRWKLVNFVRSFGKEDRELSSPGTSR